MEGFPETWNDTHFFPPLNQRLVFLRLAAIGSLIFSQISLRLTPFSFYRLEVCDSISE